MKLSDLCTIETNFPEADFWIVRRGSLTSIGSVTREFNHEHIGIKVHRLDVLLPDYLYYCLMSIHQAKRWEPLARGSLELVHIRTADLKNIRLSS